MSKRDYYDVLGVERSVDEKALKSAFRKMAMKYHPDKNPGDEKAEQNFKEVNEAYEALKDPQKRAAYDRFGHAAFQNGQGGAGGHGFGSDFSNSMSDIFDDLFGDFMGGNSRRGRSNQSRGSDLRYDLTINLQEAFEGKTAQIEIPTTVVCKICDGSGAKPGTTTSTCQTCGGMGKIRAAQGFFTIERTCPVCHGRGEIIDQPCTNCRGQGRVAQMRDLSVDIPKGIDDGTRIRLSGEGEAGERGGPPGDLYIFISVEPHSLFQRDGADLHCNAPISMTTAALGGEFDIPTLGSEKARVKLPAGTQSRTKIRLKGKGMPVLKSGQVGDMYVTVDVETPVNLTKMQKELLEEFEKSSTKKNTPSLDGFLDRLKKFF